MDNELKEALDALRIAVGEAEGWCDEYENELKPGERLGQLSACYAVLDKHGLTRIRDDKVSGGQS